MANDSVFEELGNAKPSDAERYFLKDSSGNNELVADAIPDIKLALEQSGIAAKGQQKRVLQSLLKRSKKGKHQKECSPHVRKFFNSRNATVVLGVVSPRTSTAIRNAYQIEVAQLDIELKQKQLDEMEKMEQVAVSKAEVKVSDAVTQKHPQAPHFPLQQPDDNCLSSELLPPELAKVLESADFLTYCRTRKDGTKIEIMVSKVGAIPKGYLLSDQDAS